MLLSATAKGWMIVGGFVAVSAVVYPVAIMALSDDEVEEQSQEKAAQPEPVPAPEPVVVMQKDVPAPRLSDFGESCSKTADCVEGAKCIELSCVDPEAPKPKAKKKAKKKQRQQFKEWTFYCGGSRQGGYGNHSNCMRWYGITRNKSSYHAQNCSPCVMETR